MSQQALTNIKLQNQISYLQTLCLNPNLPSGPIGPQGPQGNTGARGLTGASAFTVLLSGGATFSPTTLSTFTTNGTNGYGVTAEAYNSGCLVSAYAPRGSGTQAIYVGLSTSGTFTTSPPANSLNYGIYSDGTTVQVILSGIVQSPVQLPNSNPNYTYTVKYDNQNITFLLDGVVLDPSWVIPVGAGNTYYGGWCSYNSVTYSNLQWNQLVAGSSGGGGNPFNVQLVANAGLDVTADGAQVAGGLTVSSGLLEAQGGLSVTADGATVEGGVTLNSGDLVVNNGADSMTMAVVNNIGRIVGVQNSTDSDAALLFDGSQISTFIYDAGDQTRKTALTVGPVSVGVTGALGVSGTVACANVAVAAGGQITIGGVPIGGGSNPGIIQSFSGACTTNTLPALGSYSMFEIPYNNSSITTYSFVVTNLSFTINNFGFSSDPYNVDFWISNVKDQNRNFNSSYYTAVVPNPPTGTPTFQSTNAIFLQWQSLSGSDLGTNLYFNYKVGPDNGGNYALASVVVNAEVTGLTQTVSTVSPIYF